MPNHDFTDYKSIKPIKKYAFVFVCQEGNLEIQSLLLAASLKRFLKCNYELIAAVPLPAEKMGKPKDITINLLKKMGVKIVNIFNELVDKAPKVTRSILVTNKIYCLKIPTSAEKLIFVDSDMLCYDDFFGDICFSIPFNARLVGGVNSTVHPNGKWGQIYDAADTKMSNLRIKKTRQKYYDPEFSFTPPYFNSGFIAINKNLAAKLSNLWLECYKKIRSKNLIEDLFYTEQISLSVALHKMDIPYSILNIDYPDLSFCHYHFLEQLRNNNKMRKLARSLIKDYPKIKEIIKYNPDPNWKFLISRIRTIWIFFRRILKFTIRNIIPFTNFLI